MFNRYIIFIIFLLTYTGIMDLCGGLPLMLGAWRLEIPLLLYIFYYLNLITRKSALQPLVAAAPIFLVYGIFDAYYLQLGRLLRITEVTELAEMFLVIPVSTRIFICLLLAAFLTFLLVNVQFRRLRPLILGALPVAALLALMEGAPEVLVSAFEGTQKEINWYSDTKSTSGNGRVSLALYNEARRKMSIKRTLLYRNDSSFKQAFNDIVARVSAIPVKRNVHLVVLESFFDPDLFLSARFSRDPLHPSFTSFFKDNAGISISPVFGGATAQAEFEVLCGVPAMRELSGIEFNVFTGTRTLCLPNLLAQAGYHTMATNAFLPDFFNTTKGYEGMGFDDIYFAREYAQGRETYFSTGDVSVEDYIFDGDLFQQNLVFIENWMKKNPSRPLLNYINTIYGHLPHTIDTVKRPLVLDMLGEFKDDHLELAANQLYYRSEAIAEFVKGLIRIDPESIIILVSDHIPPLNYGPITYRELDYLGKAGDYLHMNRIYIVENGRPVKYDTIHHYDIPRIILNYLSGKNSEKSNPKTLDSDTQNTWLGTSGLKDLYMAIMANAMN